MADPDLSSSTQEISTQDPTTQDTLLDADIDMAIDLNPQLPNVATEPHPPDPRDPARKDISLRDFMSKMDDYAPIV